MRYWTGDGAERHRQGRQEWEELVKSVCSEGHTTFTSRDSNYSTWHRVSKSEEDSGTEMKCV
jgi:hypothetical protein